MLQVMSLPRRQIPVRSEDLVSDIEYVDSPSCCHARIPAESFRRHRAHSHLADIILECSRQRKKRLLIETDLPADITASSLVPALAALMKMSRRMKIAFVNSRVPADLMASFESETAAEAGGEFRYFTSLDDAESWVCEGDLKDLLMPPPTARRR